LTEKKFTPKLGEKLMKGIAASPGVAMGKVCIHKDIFSHVPAYTIEDNQIGFEIQKLKRAIEEVEEAIRRDQEKITRQLGYGGYGDVEIFSAHLSIIEDRHFLSEVIEKIATERINAAAAVLFQIKRFEEVFCKIEDTYLKERILDIRDIGKRLIESLSGPMDFDCPFEEAVIIAGVELTPKDTVQFKKERVLAFITEHYYRTRGKGIPCRHPRTIDGNSGSLRNRRVAVPHREGGFFNRRWKSGFCRD